MKIKLLEKDILDQIARLKNLLPYKNKTSEELRQRAIDILKKRALDVDVGALFTNKKEIKDAKVLMNRYLSEYSIESISDKNTLRELIYLEITHLRLQEKMNEYYAKDTKALPSQLLDSIHKNSEAILKLKEILGLTKRDTDSDYNVLQNLQKRFAKWREENQGSRTLVCPHDTCGKMILLKIRTDAWEAQGHPFFKDRIIYNKHLFKMLKKGTITKEDVASVLEVSPDYVDWIVKKVREPNGKENK